MTVITLTDCPPKVRGDLSKWLFEINTGVFVGNINVRVREELWTRICENVRSGRVTMVFSAAGEQKLDFMVHNTTWEPVDFDGIKLMRRPAPKTLTRTETNSAKNLSKAEQYLKLRRIEAARLRNEQSVPFVVIDIETTGLSDKTDEILELGALRVENGEVSAEFSQIILQDAPIPDQIRNLTGITDEEIQANGVPLKAALSDFLDFIKDARLIGHNIAFDCGFLRAGCRKCGYKTPANHVIDTLTLARRKLDDAGNFKLTTIAEKVGVEVTEAHRALADCRLTYEVFKKLNEM